MGEVASGVAGVGAYAQRGFKRAGGFREAVAARIRAAAVVVGLRVVGREALGGLVVGRRFRYASAVDEGLAEFVVGIGVVGRQTQHALVGRDDFRAAARGREGVAVAEVRGGVGGFGGEHGSIVCDGVFGVGDRDPSPGHRRAKLAVGGTRSPRRRPVEVRVGVIGAQPESGFGAGDGLVAPAQANERDPVVVGERRVGGFQALGLGVVGEGGRSAPGATEGDGQMVVGSGFGRHEGGARAGGAELPCRGGPPG